MKGSKTMPLEIQLKELELFTQVKTKTQGDMDSNLKLSEGMSHETKIHRAELDRAGNYRETDFGIIHRKTYWKFDLSKNEMGHLRTS